MREIYKHPPLRECVGENVPNLGDVPPSEVFRTCNGVVIHNIHELLTWLQGCSEYDFRYHVNDDHHKNDFAIWVREAVKDDTLADELDTELHKDRYLEKIKDRLRKST
jgi:hypothetical protein